ncbi:hypothetical protein EMCRGX_G025349 [Ephydatia muelleri]
MLLVSDGSQQCAAFGDNLVQANPSTTKRLFANISGPLTCAGNATSWNVCYYQSTTDYRSTQTYLGVYRPASASSGQYNMVPGSSFTAAVNGMTVPTGAYVCSNFALSARYTVYPGDVLVACVQDAGSGKLGVAAAVPGAVVLWYDVFGGCAALPTSPIDLSPTSATYVVLNDITLHIKLDVNECAVNNGGCQQMCHVSTPGYTCSCYNGYNLAANGLNCTMISVPPPRSISGPSSYIATRSSADISIATSSSMLISPSSSVSMPVFSPSNVLTPASSVESALSSSVPTPNTVIKVDLSFSSTSASAVTYSTSIFSTSSVVPINTMASSPQFITLQISQTGQNQTTGIIVGVVVSIVFVIGIIFIIVAAIIFRQRCVRKWSKTSQNGFGIHNRGYDDCHLEMRDLQPNPVYASVKDEGPGEPLELNNETDSYSHPRCETHNYSHLHDDDKHSSNCMPESGKEDLSYSHLHQGPEDKKQSYSYCDVSVNKKEQRDQDPKVADASYSIVIKKSSDHSHNNTQAAVEADENPYYAPASQEMELYIQLENQKILKVRRHEIETTDAMLGSGHFGGVQVAVWNGPKGKCEVAIKTLNPSSIKPEDKIKFLQEAAIMAQFKHPNVIQLYGIVTDGEQVMLVMELAGNKDLLTHLTTMRPNSFDSSTRSDFPEVLLNFSKQIALGIQYLSSKSFVHRDLAARNVLVTKDCICKIADFGMSRDLAEGQYYMSNGGLVPVKWTAPEAVCFMKYSTASDVWSYGCLLYEIWSIGGAPFKGLTNDEALQKVNTGYRLPPPPGCPLLLYQIMIKCWNPDAHLRPNFKDIYTCLSLHEDIVLAIPNEVLLTHPQFSCLTKTLRLYVLTPSCAVRYMASEVTAMFVLCLGSMMLVSDGSQQCGAFGNNLVQANPSTTRRLFANISGPLTCAGNATSWSVCYYQSTTDYRSTQTYLGVYRPASASSAQYNMVPGSSFTAAVDGTTVPTGAYVCSNFALSARYTVYPGDVLVACVQDADSGKLGVAAVVPGAVVLRYNVFGGCAALPTSPIDLSPTSATYVVLNDTTLHIKLDVNECAVNNGGCQQMCHDSTPGYTCSCYSGYKLAANGLNCSKLMCMLVYR